MSMLERSTRAYGSPSRYIQGRNELDHIREHTEIYGKKVFFLIDVFFYENLKAKFDGLYAGSGSTIQCEQFGGQCTEDEILRCTALAKELAPEVVVGIGGGKTMDTAKAVADNYRAATVIVPTTASTDAPAMGLSVIYTPQGEHIGARHYRKNPDLVLLDTEILAKAPIRFLVAGMGDALSTYPECRANLQSSSPNYVNGGPLPVWPSPRPATRPSSPRASTPERRRSWAYAPGMWRTSSRPTPSSPAWAYRTPPAPGPTPLPRASRSCPPAPSSSTARWWLLACWCS